MNAVMNYASRKAILKVFPNATHNEIDNFAGLFEIYAEAASEMMIPDQQRTPVAQMGKCREFGYSEPLGKASVEPPPLVLTENKNALSIFSGSSESAQAVEDGEQIFNRMTAQLGYNSSHYFTANIHGADVRMKVEPYYKNADPGIHRAACAGVIVTIDGDAGMSRLDSHDLNEAKIVPQSVIVVRTMYGPGQVFDAPRDIEDGVQQLRNRTDPKKPRTVAPLLGGPIRFEDAMREFTRIA